MLLAVIEEAKTLLPFFFDQCIIKQLLDSVFVICRIIKVSAVRDGPLESDGGGGRGIFSLHEFFFFSSLLVQEYFFQVKPSARIFFF